METSGKIISISNSIDAPVEKVWEYWNQPEHITKWCFAVDDWHAPYAENDLRPGGKLKTRMEAKDGSFGFDFEGTYSTIIPNKLIEYTIADGRFVKVVFIDKGDSTEIEESFEAEDQNPKEMQKQGWQNILDNFKKYIESSNIKSS